MLFNGLHMLNFGFHQLIHLKSNVQNNVGKNLRSIKKDK